MAREIDVKTYCTTVTEKLRTVKIDKQQNQSVSFENLFFFVKIADGSMAVSNYSEVMEFAASASSEPDDSLKSRMADLGAKLRELMKENGGEETEEASPEDILAAKVGTTDKQDELIAAENDPEEDYARAINKVTSDALLARIDKLCNEGKGGAPRKKTFSFKEADSEYAKFLILSDEADLSRTLLLAPAGHGKTTLLRRLMLYYAGDFAKGYGENPNIVQKNRMLRQKYFLPQERYVPFFIRLRENNDEDEDYDIVRLMEKSVEYFFSISREIVPADISSSISVDGVKGADNVINGYVVAIKQKRAELDAIKRFTESVLKFEEADRASQRYDNILLLIDGLDELSDSNKNSFLEALLRFTREYPKIRYIISTRVAGIKDESVKDIFAEMDFHCRSILPFTAAETRAYGENWIKITQPEDSREKFLSRLNQLLTNRKFAYLRNSLRGPLDHVIILKQLVARSLSMSRYLVFRDMLREYFTRHVDQQKKEAVFEDSMSLLSFIAYDMQRRDSLFVSKQDIDKAAREIRNLSFHTGLISKEKITDTVFDFMAGLAANTGLMESYKGDNGEAYTFPIRAYQEFLCAYACCHLRLDAESRMPTPVEIISENINNKKWNDVISFALSDLKNSTGTQTQYSELVEVIVNALGDSPEQKNFLLSLLETEMLISGEQAGLICEKHLSGAGLTSEQKAILDACMEYESGSAMLLALLGECRKSAEKGKEDYFEAAARAHVLWSLKRGEPFTRQAEKLLQAADAHKNKIGALMFVVAGEMVYEEKDLRFAKVLDDIEFDTELSNRVFACYGKDEDRKELAFIEALSSVWLCGKGEGSKRAKDILAENFTEFFSVLSSELNKRAIDLFALSLCRRTMTEKSDFYWAKRLVYTMGTYPAIRKLWNHPAIQHNDLVADFMKVMYDSLADVGECDIFATLFARLNYSLTVDGFLTLVSRYVSKSSEGDWVPVGKDSFNARTVRTMDLLLGEYIRKGIFDSDKAFEQVIGEVAGLIREGEYEEAALRCGEYAETIGNSRLASKLELCKAYVYIARRERTDSDPLAYDREIEVMLEMESGNRTMENFARTYFALMKGDSEKAKEYGIKIDWARLSDEIAVKLILGERSVMDFIAGVVIDSMNAGDENLRELAGKMTSAI